MSQTSGDIQNEGVLDLTWAQSAEDLQGITSLTNIGLIKVPAQLASALSAIPRKNVGAIFHVKPGPRKDMTGPLRISGEMLAHGDPEVTLLITGQIMITPPIESIGYKEISIVGQAILPRGSEGVLGSKLGDVMGQICYVSWDKGEPRQFVGNESIGADFMDLVEPAAWIIIGNVKLEDSVTAEMLRAKVNEIALVGNLSAPKRLLPLLQVLTRQKMGNIEESKPDDADEEG